MTELNLTDFFKGIVDSEEGPIIICDMDYKIIYVNPSAVTYYKSGPKHLGKHLEVFMNEDMMSMVRISAQWLKESGSNNRVFTLHAHTATKDQ